MTEPHTSSEKLDLSALRKKIEARIAEIQQEQKPGSMQHLDASESSPEPQEHKVTATLHSSDPSKGSYRNVMPPPPSLSSMLAAENPAPIRRASYPKALVYAEKPAEKPVPQKSATLLDKLNKASARSENTDFSLRFPETSEPLSLSMDWVVASTA